MTSKSKIHKYLSSGPPMPFGGADVGLGLAAIVVLEADVVAIDVVKLETVVETVVVEAVVVEQTLVLVVGSRLLLDV